MIPMSNKRVETANISVRTSLSRKKILGTIIKELNLILIMFSDTHIKDVMITPMALHLTGVGVVLGQKRS